MLENCFTKGENQRTVEDDLRSARTLITQLEAKLASAELSRKKSTVEYDQIIATLKREREVTLHLLTVNTYLCYRVS